MQSAVLFLLFSANLASANLNCYYDASTYSSYYDSYNEMDMRCPDPAIYCFMQTTTLGNNTYLRLADCDYGYGTICLFSGCTTLGSTETCCCRPKDCNRPSAPVLPTTAPMVRSSGHPATANLYCYLDISTYNNYYDSYNERPVPCPYLTSYCFMQTTTVGNNTYRRLADCDYGYGKICLFSGCKTQGQDETCCCRTNYCNHPSAPVIATTAPMVRSSGYPATANLYCYHDASTYSNYYDSYNQSAVQCPYLTSFCFMQTTNFGNYIARVADCDYSRMCVVSGCYTQGGIETCCCMTNDCNQPTTLQPHNSAAPQSSGYSAALPIIFTVLSYAFLK